MVNKVVFILLSFLLFASAFAQNPYFLGSPTATPAPTSASPSAPSTSILSPTEFTAEVNQLANQNDDNARKDLQETLAKAKNPKIDTSYQTEKSTPPTPSPKEMTTKETTPAPLPVPTPAETQTPAPANEPYTGFGGGSSTSGGSSTPAPRSGGFNVNY